MRAGGTTALDAIAAARRLLAEHLAARARPSPGPLLLVPMMRHPEVSFSPPAAPSFSLPAQHQHQQQWRAASHSPHHHHDCKDAACDHPAHQAADATQNDAGGGARTASPPSSSLEQQEATCWSCNHATRRGGIVCRGCDRIQPLDTQGLTYYELFGYGVGSDGGGGGGGAAADANGGGRRGGGNGGSSTGSPRPPSSGTTNHSSKRKSRWPPYALDPRDLERRYRELQWALHPDRLTGPGREAQEVAHGAAAAALVNQAYGVLRSPLARANYLLMLRRLPPEARAGGGGGGTGPEAAARRAAAERAAARLVDEEERRTAADPALLMEVMEAREAVEDADDPAELRAMLARNREAQADLVRQLGAALDGEEGSGGNENDDGCGGDGDDQQDKDEDEDAERRAQELAARLSYLVRIQQAIEAKL